MENNLLRLDDMEDLGDTTDLTLNELQGFGCTPVQALAICGTLPGELYCDEQADGTKRFFIVDFGHCSEEYEGDEAEAVEIHISGTIEDIVLDARW